MKKPSTIIITFFFFLILIQRVRTQVQPTAPGFEQTPSNDHNSKGPPWRVMVVATLLFLGGYLIYLFCFIRVSNWRTWQPPWRPFTTSLRPHSPTSTARTLDPAVVKSFPTFEYATIKSGIITNNKPTLECAVCLAEYDDDDVLRLIPKCDHVFHADCVDEWLVEHATCPVCRRTLENVEFRSVNDQSDVVLEEENEMMRSLSGRLRLFTGLRRSFSAGHVEERQPEDMERFRITGEMREEIMSKSERIEKGKGNWVFGLTASSREELEKEKGARLSAANKITTKEKGSSSMQLAV